MFIPMPHFGFRRFTQKTSRQTFHTQQPRLLTLNVQVLPSLFLVGPNWPDIPLLDVDAMTSAALRTS